MLRFGVLKINLKRTDVHFLWHCLEQKRKYYLPFVSIAIQADILSNHMIKLTNSLTC